jgi:hypothetical protein
MPSAARTSVTPGRLLAPSWFSARCYATPHSLGNWIMGIRMTLGVGIVAVLYAAMPLCCAADRLNECAHVDCR